MPRVPAEFIEDHGQVAALPLHVDQQVATGPARGRQGHGPDRQRIARLQLEEVEGVDHTDDFVEGFAIYRNAAVAALREGP